MTRLLLTTQRRGDMTAAPPFGPGFSEEIVAKARHMEIHGSDFSDQGEDQCVFILYDGEGREITRRCMPGY